MNIYSVEEQMIRYNITKEEAEEKIRKIKDVNVFSIEWQIKKFNITEEEAKEKIRKIKDKLKDSQSKMSEFDFNSMMPSKKEHWIKKGLSEEDAIVMSSNIIKIATKNCRDITKDRIDNPNKYLGTFDTCIEYYLNKGHSIEESKVLLKERQSTFSLEKCISKLGIDNGIKRWKERQDKWIRSVEGKITNEMRDSYSYNHFFNKNNGNVELSKIEYQAVFEKRYLNSKIGRASKSSMKVFSHLINKCIENKLKYYCGYLDSKEFYIMSDDNKIYAYDFTIPSIKLIFEFHGKFWHTKVESEVINELGHSMSESFKKDQIKKELAIKNNFKIVELFEEDGLEYNIKKSINSLIDLTKG